MIVLDKEAMEMMKERFPRFSKIQKTMINNEEYGVTLSPEAVRYLKKKGKIPRRKYVRRKNING